MTQSQKDVLVKLLYTERASAHYHFTLKTIDLFPDNEPTSVIKWQIRLIPEVYQISHIGDILDAVKEANELICMSLSTEEGGCLMLF